MKVYRWTLALSCPGVTLKLSGDTAWGAVRGIGERVVSS